MSTHLLPPQVQVIERGWLSANMVIFKGEGDHAVLDSGYVSHAEQTVALVRSALGGQSLGRLLNTHLHSDHCGGNAALQAAFPDLVTLIPPGHAEQVREWDAKALTYEATGQLCPRFGFHGLLQPGTDIRLAGRPWQIHAAAGHDPHSVILFEPQSRCLISADALWENGFGVVFPELEGEDAFSAVSDTLDLIESLQPLTVVPGHGAVFTYSSEILGRSRSRLASFKADPVKHARHAAKVLLKFKLLELQRQRLALFLGWAEGTPYLKMVHQRYFSDVEFVGWILALCEDLVKSQVARSENGELINV